MGALRDTVVKMRCLPMSGLLSGTPCLTEKAWICCSFNLEDAQHCKRAMHFWRICGIGFCGEAGERAESAEKRVLGL